MMEQDLIIRHKIFFENFFQTEEELELFITAKLNCSNVLPRRMINTVQRLVTLSDEIEIIRPGRRDLSIFFIITCIEALFTFLPTKIQKQEMVIQMYEKHLNETDRKTIEQSINVSLVDDTMFYKPEISISEFALLLSSIRNNVAHEGNYWSFHFNEEGYEGRTLNIVKSKLIKDEGYKNISYEVSLTYNQFRDITVRTLILFIEDYFQTIQHE
ncbi:hypothetical protein MKX70_20115 [Paenibacillus sp. FSL R7-0312]|uniref:hypothetical protein n=1 Tax=Paenibacillus sp. FSL R7-0312 TaxID=2921682 RepID=UPI0030FBB00B